MDDEAIAHAVVERVGDGTWRWDLAAQSLKTSPRWRAMLGLSQLQLTDRVDEWFGRIHPDDLERTQREVSAFVKGHVPVLVCVHRLRHHLGGYRWVLCRAIPEGEGEGPPRRIRGTLTDVTAGVRPIGDAERRALTDRVTGLPTAVVLVDRIAQAVSRLRRSDSRRFAVLAVEIHLWEELRAKLGHVLSDRLLVEVGRRIHRAVHPSDTVALTDPGTFHVLLEEVVDEAAAEATAKAIERAMEPPTTLGAHEVFPSISVGLVMSRTRYDRPEELLRDASVALRNARERPAQRRATYQTRMDNTALQKQLLAVGLSEAASRGQLGLELEPVIALDGGEIVGFVAGVTWDHPVRGRVPPSEFLPVAEGSELILELDRWAIVTAAQTLRRLEGVRELRLRVSHRHFEGSEFLDVVAEALASAGVKGERLRLSVSESGLMAQAGTSRRVLKWLETLGVTVQLHGFGAGYSSLSDLAHLPLGGVALDPSFSPGLGHDPRQERVVRGLVAIARSYGLPVLVEQIADAGQMSAAAALGCDLASGPHVGPPGTVAEARALLS